MFRAGLSPAGLSFYWRIATLFLREERATEEKVCLGETRNSPGPSPPGDPTAPPGGSLLKTLDSKGAQNNWSSILGAGKDRNQEEKEMTEDEIAGLHHQLHGHEFEQTLRDGKGQGSLDYCSL